MAEKTIPKTEKASSEPSSEPSNERLERFFDQIQQIETKNRDAAYQAIDEYAKLMKATVDYSTRLQDEWRRIALESSRRAADMMTAWV